MATIKKLDLDIGEELGSGGFSTVYNGLWKTPNKQVAVKKLNKVDFQEIKILQQLQHPNIVTLYGFVHEEMDLMMVLELCEVGSLRSYLETNKDKPLPPPLTYDWMLQAALPINYLRNNNIEHMDIKTDNYVINSNMVLKLTDFGLSQILENTRSYSSEAGSWRWMPPERLRDHKLSPKFDIYALALVFWCLLTCRPLPFSEYPSEYSVAEAVCIRKERPPLPSTCPEPVGDLIEACWHDDRSKRPDIKDVIITLVLHKFTFGCNIKPASSSPVLKTRMAQTNTGKCIDTATQTDGKYFVF